MKVVSLKFDSRLKANVIHTIIDSQEVIDIEYSRVPTSKRGFITVEVYIQAPDINYITMCEINTFVDMFGATCLEIKCKKG